MEQRTRRILSRTRTNVPSAVVLSNINEIAMRRLHNEELTYTIGRTRVSTG